MRYNLFHYCNLHRLTFVTYFFLQDEPEVETPNESEIQFATQLMARCINMVHLLGLVESRLEEAIGDMECIHLRRFGDAIIEYKDLFLENFKKRATNAKEKCYQELELVVQVAENHWLVQPDRLERWIAFRQSELEMSFRLFEWITKGEGFVYLTNENHLKEEVASLGNEFAIVLSIPSPDEWSDNVAEEMKNTDPFSTPSQFPMEDVDPWPFRKEERKLIYGRVRDFSKYMKANKSEEMKYYVMFEDSSRCSGGHFNIYQREKMMKSNLKNLPIQIPSATSDLPKQKSQTPKQIAELKHLKKNEDGASKLKIVQIYELPAGEFATNCSECNVTCSRYSEQIGEAPEAFCTTCPGKCSFMCHLFNSSVVFN